MCILAVDSGTSSCRTVAFGLDGRFGHVSQQEFVQHYPRPGWVEHDATEILRVQVGTLQNVLARHADAVAVGITNQRETVVVWDRRTGQPIHHAIVWQDRRTADVMHTLQSQSDVVDLVRARTGLVMDPYFTASKLKWLLDEVDGARAAARDGHLAFGTIDCWLAWNLTGGVEGGVHITDVSNASRTMLYDIHRGCWDADLLDVFDIPESVLPEVVDCAGDFGALRINGDSNVRLHGMIGDQQSALFGQGCHSTGSAKTTFGTGCFLLMNTGEEAAPSEHGLLTTVAWRIPGGTMTYALEGSVFMGGASIQWLRDGLKIIDSARAVNDLAASVDDTEGVVLVPAFAGLGAPDWDAWGRAAIFGLTRGSTDAHVARATLEGIAMSVHDVLAAMTNDSGIELAEMRVDGGAAASDLLMQIQADVLGVSVHRPAMLETTAWGAAAMAGLGAGLFDSPEDVAAHWHLDRTFDPSGDPQRRERKLRTWRRAVDRVKGWAREDDDAS